VTGTKTVSVSVPNPDRNGSKSPFKETSHCCRAPPWLISGAGLRETRVQRQMINKRTQEHAYAKLKYAFSVQKCGVCNKNLLID